MCSWSSRINSIISTVFVTSFPSVIPPATTMNDAPATLMIAAAKLCRAMLRVSLSGIEIKLGKVQGKIKLTRFHIIRN